jgi:hypothetical protein
VAAAVRTIAHRRQQGNSPTARPSRSLEEIDLDLRRRGNVPPSQATGATIALETTEGKGKTLRRTMPMRIMSTPAKRVMLPRNLKKTLLSSAAWNRLAANAPSTP